MGTAVLLGIPLGYVRTAKSAIESNEPLFSGWGVKFSTSNGKAPGIFHRDLRRIQEFAGRHGDIHVLGFSDDKNRQTIADELVPFFRFRWFKHELLKHLGSPDPSRFVDRLASDLAEEAEWANSVKPEDLGSPLLLPECAFQFSKSHSDLWRHALAYGDFQNILGAQRALAAFRSTYHRKVDRMNFSKYTWLDERDRIFDKDGARHGKPLFPRDHKYSFRLEPGFHFDVSHLSGHKFVVKDIDGTSKAVKAGAHLNIDPHWHVRT